MNYETEINSLKKRVDLENCCAEFRSYKDKMGRMDELERSGMRELTDRCLLRDKS